MEHHGKSGSLLCMNAISNPNSISPAPAFPNLHPGTQRPETSLIPSLQSLHSNPVATLAFCPHTFDRDQLTLVGFQYDKPKRNSNLAGLPTMPTAP